VQIQQLGMISQHPSLQSFPEGVGSNAAASQHGWNSNAAQQACYVRPQHD